MKKILLILVVISLTGFGQTATDYFNKGISKFNLKDYKSELSLINLERKLREKRVFNLTFFN